MPVVRRDVRLGRINLVTIEGEVVEALGDTLSAVGGGIVPGERRARSFSLMLPVRGDSTETNPYLAGDKLRRQVRSLMENARTKLEGQYFRFFVDQELNSWLVIGTGDLRYSAGGISLADFELSLSETFKIGSLRTHKPARRLERYDRRLVTSPRDYMGTVYLTDFSAINAISQHFVPPTFSSVETVHRAVLAPVTRPTIGGNIGVLVDRTHGEVVSFEQAEDSIVSGGDVVVFDRKEFRSPTETIRTNLITNPSFETNTTGWTAANATVARVGLQRPFGKFVGRSTRTAGGGDTSMASFALTFGSSAAHTVSLYVYIPSAWDGTALNLNAENYAGATGTLIANASLGTRDSWQRLSFTFTPAGGDLAGNIVLRATGSSAGSILLLDGMLVESGSTLNEYFDGDGEWADWTGAAHGSTSRWYGDPEDYGWEEVYGSDYPFTASDAPVIQNGITRVRAHATTAGVFMVDSFVAGTGWQEQGAFYVRRVTTGGTVFTRYDDFKSGRVVEWTQERGVITCVLGIAAESGEHAHLYISLQRGWTGPRVEAYPMSAGAMPGAEVVWEPFDSGAATLTWGQVAGGGASSVASDDPGVTWNATVQRTVAAPDEPFAVLDPASRKTAIITFLRYGVRIVTIDSTVGYGSTRKAVSIRSHDGTSQEGYVSAHLGFVGTGAQITVEAEAHDNAGSGTSTGVVDANAAPGSGTSAIEETQTAATAATLIISSAALDAAGLGSMGIWVRVRVVTGGATGSINANFTGETATTTRTFTSTTYVWVYLGTNVRGASDTLSVTMWRSAGSGNTRIDRVAVAPFQNATEDGVQDHSAASLWDSMQVPTIVSR